MGAPLDRIERLRDDMTVSAKRGIFEILKVQSLVLFMIVLFAGDVLRFFGISELFLPLLYVLAAAVGVQVLLLAILNVFFYLDQRGTALRICLVFAVTNTIGTIVSHKLGYVFYGYRLLHFPWSRQLSSAWPCSIAVSMGWCEIRS